MKAKIKAAVKFLLIYAAIPAAVAILPLLVSAAGWPFIGNTYGKAYEPFELFGFFAALALVAGVVLKIRSRREKTWKSLAPVVLFLVISFYFLTLITEYSHKLGDYMCYEAAAGAVLAGENPYSGTNYIYPPLTAEALAALYKGIRFGSNLLGFARDQQNYWEDVFYLYQCLQYFLIVISYLLCVRLARNLGLQPEIASALVAVLFVLNNPLVRTLRHNQTNLLVLCAILGSVLLLPKHPSASGLSLALGIHFKLYPSLLLPYWAALRKIKPLLWTLFWSSCILAVETKFFRDFSFWRNFLDFFKSFPKGIFFRDNSFYSLFLNSFDLLVRRLLRINWSQETLSTAVNIAVWAVNTGLLVWFLLRFLKRRGEKAGLNPYALYASLFDAVALMLLLSPRVWEHHYVLALPLVIYAAAVGGARTPWRIGLAAFLMFALPTFDVFPLSYHRLAGLLILVCSTGPRAVRRGAFEKN